MPVAASLPGHRVFAAFVDISNGGVDSVLPAGWSLAQGAGGVGFIRVTHNLNVDPTLLGVSVTSQATQGIVSLSKVNSSPNVLEFTHSAFGGASNFPFFLMVVVP